MDYWPPEVYLWVHRIELVVVIVCVFLLGYYIGKARGRVIGLRKWQEWDYNKGEITSRRRIKRHG